MYNQPDWTKFGTHKIEELQNTCIQMSNLLREVLKFISLLLKRP